MIENYSEILSDEFRETEMQFCFYNNKGMNIVQVLEIKVLAKKYMKMYPAVGISKICDYYSYDYQNKTVNEYIYNHSKSGELYKEFDNIAFYSWDDRVIAFNHIQCNNMVLDDMGLMKRNKISKNSFLGDRLQIKFYEKVKTIKTIFIHEFAHAIENQFRVYDDERIKDLYIENNKNGLFKDIHEFIAECFVVCEYFPINKTAMEVKNIMNEYHNEYEKLLKEE